MTVYYNWEIACLVSREVMLVYDAYSVGLSDEKRRYSRALTGLQYVTVTRL